MSDVAKIDAPTVKNKVKYDKKYCVSVMSRSNSRIVIETGSIQMRKVFITKHYPSIKGFIAGFFVLVLASFNISAQDKQSSKDQYQPPKQISSGSAQTSSVIVSSDEDYLIGPSDIVEIKIEDAPELSGVFRLNSKGTLTLPVVGLITAQKKTTEQVAKEISDKLRGGYLTNPIVSVSVRQTNSRSFFIQGAVRSPGIYQIEGRPSLLKLITIAGGLADNYGSTAFIIREKKDTGDSTGDKSADVAPVNTQEADGQKKEVSSLAEIKKGEPENDAESGPEYELIKANINNLLRGNFEQNLIIQTGDIIHIPQSDVFFVAGEVKAPGTFPLKEGTTLRQAISLAQGTNYQGDLDHGIIFRDDQSGKRQEIKVDISAVMSGKKEDITIFPNDIVMVPNSKKKTVAKGAAKIISGGILRSIFGF